MGADSGRCDNCGAIDVLVPCTSVWQEEHTHPLAHDDLRPVACDLDLCGKCTRLVRRNLSKRRFAEDAGCWCCNDRIVERDPDPWEGRLDGYCEACALTRCDAYPGACRHAARSDASANASQEAET